MNKNLTKVALRYRALFLDIKREDIDMKSNTSVMTRAFAARLMENGFSLSEELLHALDMVSTDTLADTVECINNIMGVNLNWASLVKGWDKPTKETNTDHLITWIANIFGMENLFNPKRSLEKISSKM